MGAGQFQSQNRYHCRLAGSFVLAGGFTDLRRVSFHVQYVVGDLERRAKITAIRRKKMALL